MQSADPECSTERVAALELIPGHASTTAEVWIWQGHVPELDGEPRPWVMLRSDDWPMSSEAARELAAALIRAAERVETSGARRPRVGPRPQESRGQ